MSGHCTVCRHSRSVEIDSALMGGVGIRPLSRRFGLSRQSLARHQANHVGKVLRAALERQVEEKGDRMVALFESILIDLERVQRKAEGKDNLSAALGSIAHKIRLLELGAAASAHRSKAEEEGQLKDLVITFNTDGKVLHEYDKRVTPEPASEPIAVSGWPDPQAPAPERQEVATSPRGGEGSEVALEPETPRALPATAPPHACGPRCTRFSCATVNEATDELNVEDRWRAF